MIVAGGLGIAFGLGVATFVVVVYGTCFAAMAALGWAPLEPRPDLDVGFWKNGEMIQTHEIAAESSCLPIDIDACIRNGATVARRSVPAKTPLPSGDFAALAGPFAAMRESYDEALKRFERELADYQTGLQSWLAGYERRRWPNYSFVRLPIAVCNRGQSAADGVILRLVLPTGLTAIRKDGFLFITPPPEGPVFERRVHLRDLGGISRLLPPVSKFNLPTTTQASDQRSHVREGGKQDRGRVPRRYADAWCHAAQ